MKKIGLRFFTKEILGIVISSIFLITIVSLFTLARTEIFDWDFSNAGDYSYSDVLKVEVDGNVAKLSPVDQAVDSQAEFDNGIYRPPANPRTEYNTGMVQLSANGLLNGNGRYESPLFDAGLDNASWNTISWIPDRPYMKALPDMMQTETGYNSANFDMSNNLLLFHMDEDPANDTGVINDASGNGNNGILSTSDGGNKSRNNGVFNKTIFFDGNNDYIDAADTGIILDFNPSQSYSWSAWLKKNDITNVDPLFYKGSGTGGYVIASGNLANMPLAAADATNLANRITCPGAFGGFGTNWAHMAVTYNGSTGVFTLYINGQQCNSGALGTPLAADNTSNMEIGRSTGGFFTDGRIDEAAYFTGELTPSQVDDLYKRGVFGDVEVKIRSCDSLTGCDAEQFIGPDGTIGSKFLDSDNNTATTPSFDFTGVVPDNRYFQYQLNIKTDNGVDNPGVLSVNVGPDHYPLDNPTVQNNSSPKTGSFNTFLETLGGGSQGIIEYQISNDQTNWFYWDGTSWILETGAGYPTETSPELDVRNYIQNFSGGSLYFKAFLHTDDPDLTPELDNVSVAFKTPEAGGEGTTGPGAGGGGGLGGSLEEEIFQAPAEEGESEEGEEGDPAIEGEGEITQEEGEGEGEQYIILNKCIPLVDIEGHEAENYINYFWEEQIVCGVGNGVFNPDGEVLRVEFLKILLHGFGYKIPLEVSQMPFDDVGTFSWFAPYVLKARELGIAPGFPDGTYRPFDPVTRIQALRMLMDLTRLIGINNGDATYLEYAEANGFITGYSDGTYDANATLSRAEACEMAYKIFRHVGVIF